MKIIFKFHFKMRWINLNFILLQLLSTLASVHCSEEHDIYPFSESLNSGMDNNTDACNNFHEYACGKWIEGNQKPDIWKEWNVNEMTVLSTKIKINEILEDPNTDANNEELSVEKKFYNACMDGDYSQKEGAQLLQKILDNTPREGWYNVAEYYATKFSAFHLFHIKLTESKHLQIERPRFSKSNKRPFGDMRKKLINNVKWLYIHGNNSYINYIPSHTKALKESLHFIEKVNKITRYGEEDIQTFSISTLQKLHEFTCPTVFGRIEWLQFFQKLAEGTNINFTEEDEVKVDMQYLIGLSKLLCETSEHAIVNYLLYNFVFDVDITNYVKMIRHEMSYTERYIHCIGILKITNGINKEIMSHLSQKRLKMVEEMFYNIKSAMIKEIENSWLVGVVKEEALQKAKGIEWKYRLNNDPFKKKLGTEVTYQFEVGRVAIQNELNLRRAQIINILQVYNEVHKLHRAKRHLICNAFYQKDDNAVIIKIAMLFPPYFYENAPIGYNYGRLGFTIGHEISHAFDLDILLYFVDCVRSKHERETMNSMLAERINCFVNEFHSLGISGERTLDENVADTQGLKLAWKAMNAVIEDRGTNIERITYFKDWNEKKLFFLSFANLFCSNPRYEKDDGVDKHSPFSIRVRGTLMNMNEFEHIYNCNRDSISKCDLWA